MVIFVTGRKDKTPANFAKSPRKLWLSHEKFTRYDSHIRLLFLEDSCNHQPLEIVKHRPLAICQHMNRGNEPLLDI